MAKNFLLHRIFYSIFVSLAWFTTQTMTMFEFIKNISMQLTKRE